MNRYLRNVLTVSATTLMMLGVSGLANHAHTHACTTAFNEVSLSPDMVASYVQKAESYDNGDGSNDAYNFLNDNEPKKLFSNYYLSPCDEQQYKVATIGRLADDMNGYDGYATRDNKNSIANSLDQKEMTIYNDELSHDGAQLNTHINSSSYSDNVPLTTNPTKLTVIKNINKRINDAENSDDNGNGSDDAYSFLNNDSGNVVLFNHFYSDPNSENAYKLAVIGHLADNMNTYDAYATDANKNNIKQSLTPEQLTLYNIRLGEDGAQLNAYVSQSPYQFADSNNTSETSRPAVPPKELSNNNKSNEPNTLSNPKEAIKPNITVIKPAKRKARIIVKPRKRVAKHITRRHRAVRRHVARRAVRRARYGYFVHGHYIKYQFGYFNKSGHWVKYRSGHYTKRGKWIRNLSRKATTKRNKRSKRNKRYVSKRRTRRSRVRKPQKRSRRRVRRY